MHASAKFNALYFLCFLLASPTLASEVLKTSATGKYLVVSQDVEPIFKVADYACVIEDRVEIACGYISIATPRGAVLYMQNSFKKVEVGDTVDHATKAHPELSFAETLETQDIDESIPLYKMLFGHGPTIKESEEAPKYSLAGEMFFTNPTLQWETIMEPRLTWTLELSLNQFSSLNFNQFDPVKGTLVGALINFNYYDHDTFQGIWLRGGAGYYTGTVQFNNASDNSGTLTAIATIGYRWLRNNITYGISTGVQYFNVVETQDLPYNISLFTPIIGIHVGWLF